MSFFKKNITFNYLTTFILLTIFSLFLTLISLAFEPLPIVDVLLNAKNSNYLMIFLNFLPVALLVFLVFFLTNNIVISATVTLFAITLLSFLNRLKIQLRNDPLRISDITLGAEFFKISNFMNFKNISITIILVIISVLILFFINKFIKNRKFNVKFRLFFIATTASFLYLSNQTILKDDKLYTSLPVIGNEYNPTVISNYRGFIYTFIYSFNKNKVSKPEGYNKSNIQSLVNSEKIADPNNEKKLPNIIMIMSEAYSDIAFSKGIDFNGYQDPTKALKDILEESINGSIVVANVGGGTADTEFDVLTGINTRQFRGVAYSNLLITEPFKSINSIFNTLGFENISIHPGFNWFYNRLNVYEYLGFSSLIDITQFDENKYKGMYVDETSTMDRIIEKFEDHIKTSEKPFFDFAINIQNHGPYHDKYLVDTNFNNSVDLNKEEVNALSNYFEGYNDQTRELKRLVDYLKNIDEPTVLVYFGDHLPALSIDTYTKLIEGYDEPKDSFKNNTRMYETPFYIWENNAAKNIVDFSDYELKNKTFSSFYLGALLLELLDINKYDPFFKFINSMRDTYPVILENLYFSNDKQIHNIDGTNEDIQKLLDWNYYRTFDE